MSAWKLIENYWKDTWRENEQSLQQKIKMYEKYGKKLQQIDLKVKKMKTISYRESTEVTYQLCMKLLIQDQGSYYHEEMIENRQAIVGDNELIEDKEIGFPKESDREKITVDRSQVRFSYDRKAAVQYAERWWNDANPAYHFFELNDCTNYISQSIHAGGAPMHGAPNRSKGWWYENDNWSYSWSVAHAFRWILGDSTSKIKGTELTEPTELLPGDVICYDFAGDGRWDHTTIVVAKDSQNVPLVNAHTNNSRHRYWTYEDSAAWTPECQYRFFRIGE